MKVNILSVAQPLDAEKHRSIPERPSPNMIDENIKQKYPHLVDAYERRGGDEKLSAKHHAAVAKMQPIRNTLDIYYKELRRGLVHTAGWNVKMTHLGEELAQLEKECTAALDAWKTTVPPYDANNQIADCGCVIINGERVHWCGDHY